MENKRQKGTAYIRPPVSADTQKRILAQKGKYYIDPKTGVVRQDLPANTPLERVGDVFRPKVAMPNPNRGNASPQSYRPSPVQPFVSKAPANVVVPQRLGDNYNPQIHDIHPSGNQRMYPMEKLPSNNHKWAWIIGVLLLVIVAGGLFALYQGFSRPADELSANAGSELVIPLQTNTPPSIEKSITNLQLVSIVNDDGTYETDSDGIVQDKAMFRMEVHGADEELYLGTELFGPNGRQIDEVTNTRYARFSFSEGLTTHPFIYSLYFDQTDMRGEYTQIFRLFTTDGTTVDTKEVRFEVE